MRLILATWSVEERLEWFSAYPANAHKGLAEGKSPVGAVSLMNMAKVLNQFRQTLVFNRPDLLMLPFQAKMTPDVLLLFVDDLVDTADEGTIRQYLEMLQRYYGRLSSALLPGPVRRLIKFFKSRPRGCGKHPVTTAAHLWRAANARLDAMTKSFQDSSRTAMTESEFITFRNYSMVAFLTLETLRLKNLTEMGCKKHMFKSFSRYKLQFSPEEMKNGLGYSTTVDARLTGILDELLSQRAKIIGRCASPATDRVWVDYDGKSLSPAQIHNILCKTSEYLVGERLTAHQFRYMLADSAKANGATNSEISVPLQHAKPSQVTDGYIKTRNMSSHIANRKTFSANLRKQIHFTL